MPAPKAPDGKKKKKCEKGACGAFILYVTNFLLLVVGVAGAALGGLVIAGQAGVTSVVGLDSASLDAFVPKTFVYFALATSATIVVIAFLGFVGTCCQMKENKLAREEKAKGKDATVGGGLGKQGCCSRDACMSCWLDLYILLTFIGLIVLIAAAGVGAAALVGVSVSDVEEFVSNSCGTVGIECSGTVSGVLAKVLNYVDNWIDTNRDGQSWAAAQNALRCCGWWTNETSGYTSGIATDPSGIDCCVGGNVTYQDALTFAVGSAEIELLGGSSCRGFESTTTAAASGGRRLGNVVYTCGALVVNFIKQNTKTLAIGVFVFGFLTLVCFISALVVRCAINPTKKKKKKKKQKVGDEPKA